MPRPYTNIDAYKRQLGNVVDQTLPGNPQQMQQFQNAMQENQNMQQAGLQQGPMPAQPQMGMQAPSMPMMPMPGQQQPMPPANVSAIDLLVKSGLAKEVEESKEQEISLKTLKKSEIDKIMDAFSRGKNVADDYYKDTIEPKLREREEAYLATEEYYKHRFPILSETSKFCSRDIKTTVDTLIPSFVEVFAGSEDPVSVKGVSVDDDERADKVQQLLKYQLQRKNKYTPFIEYIVKDSLILNFAVSKVYWKREEEHQQYQMMLSANDMDTITVLYQAFQKGDIDIIEAAPIPDAPDLVALTFDKVTLKSNYPVISYMPPSELRFTPDGQTLQECKFKAHRKIVTGDYLKRKEQEGIYQNIDKALEDSSDGDTSYTDFDLNKNEELDTIDKRIDDNDKASKAIELYEAYLQVDYNNDGVYENVIVHAVGDTPIRISNNEFDIAPFFVCESARSPHKVFNDKEGLCDNILQQQDLKTAIFRQCIVNVAKNNSPRLFVDSRLVDMDALMNNDEFISVDVTQGNNVGSAVYVLPQLPFNQMANTILQYSQNEIESQSGSTRYNQGLDSNSLNKTATGLTAIMGASERRAKNTARMMAETFIVPMMKYIIHLNQKYMKDDEIVRLTNSSVTITKDDLDVDYDLIINIGQGVGTKEAEIQYLMLMLNTIFPNLEQRGLTDPGSWFDVSKELLSKMGLRNITNSLVDPNSPKGQQLKAQAQQAQQAQMQAAMQMQQEQEKAKAALELEKARTPRLSVQYKDLPMDAKMQALKANGINTTGDSLKAQEVVNNA